MYADELFAGYNYIGSLKSPDPALPIGDSDDPKSTNKSVQAQYAHLFFKDPSTQRGAYKAVTPFFDFARAQGLSAIASGNYAHIMGPSPYANFPRIESLESAEGIEDRAPFASSRMLAIAGRLPDDMLVRKLPDKDERISKYLLRKLAEPYMAKLGGLFKASNLSPQLTYMDGESKEIVRHSLQEALDNSKKEGPEKEELLTDKSDLEEYVKDPAKTKGRVNINYAFSSFVLREWVRYNRELKHKLEQKPKTYVELATINSAPFSIDAIAGSSSANLSAASPFL